MSLAWQPTADGIRATFYRNAFFEGSPVGYRDDETIDLRVEGLPPMRGVSIQSFSVRWEGYLVPTVSDRYRLFTYADCGIRVFLDDSPIIVDRMPAPDEGAAFADKPIQPLHPSGFTGVAKIFSGPQVSVCLTLGFRAVPGSPRAKQELKAAHRHRLRVEFFHLSSHKFKNPDSVPMRQTCSVKCFL